MARGFIVQPTYRVRDGAPVVQLFGRLESGAAFLVEDDRFRPYFFARAEARAAARARARRRASSRRELRDLAGRAARARESRRCRAPCRACASGSRRAACARSRRTSASPYRYLIDRGLRAAVAIDGEPERRRRGLVRFRNPSSRPASARPALRVLSLDLETTPDASRVLVRGARRRGRGRGAPASRARRCAGAHRARRRARAAARARRAHPRARPRRAHRLERGRLRPARARSRARRALGVPFELGRAPGRGRASAGRLGFTRQRRAEIPGRMVLDGIALVRDAFIALDDFSLETAARALLGRGKRIDHDAPRRRAPRSSACTARTPRRSSPTTARTRGSCWRSSRARGCSTLAIERSLLSGMQLDRVGASIASFDLLYLPELRRRGRVAPCVERERARRSRVLGRRGARLAPGPLPQRRGVRLQEPVPEPDPHLQPRSARARARRATDAIVAPNGARFARDERDPARGASSASWRAARQAKRRGDRHADQAIKIMMNALFGVLGAPSCRFFDPAIANAITGFGQQMLQLDARRVRGGGRARALRRHRLGVRAARRRRAASARESADALRARVQAAIARAGARASTASSRASSSSSSASTSASSCRACAAARSGSRKRYAGLAATARLERGRARGGAARLARGRAAPAARHARAPFRTSRSRRPSCARSSPSCSRARSTPSS